MTFDRVLLLFAATALAACPADEPADDDDDSFPVVDDDDSTPTGDDDDSTPPGDDDDSTPPGDDDSALNCTPVRGSADITPNAMPSAWGAVSVFLFKPENLSPQGFPKGKPDGSYTVEGPALTAFPINWDICIDADGPFTVMGVFDANNSGDICDAGDFHGLTPVTITPGVPLEGVVLSLSTVLAEGCRDEGGSPPP